MVRLIAAERRMTAVGIKSWLGTASAHFASRLGTSSASSRACSSRCARRSYSRCGVGPSRGPLPPHVVTRCRCSSGWGPRRRTSCTRQRHQARVATAGGTACASGHRDEASAGVRVDVTSCRLLRRRAPLASGVNPQGISSSFCATPAGPSLIPGAPPVPGAPAVPKLRVAWPVGLVPL